MDANKDQLIIDITAADIYAVMLEARRLYEAAGEAAVAWHKANPQPDQDPDKIAILPWDLAGEFQIPFIAQALSSPLPSPPQS